MKYFMIQLWLKIQMFLLKIAEILLYIVGYGIVAILYILMFGAIFSIFAIPIVILFKLIV